MVKKEIREITSELVEAYMQCERQAFLILEGKIEGKEHEYSQILKERATENQSRFEASLEVGQKGVADEMNDMCHVVRSDDMMADCLTLIKSESKPLLKTPAKFELYLLIGTYSVSKEQRQLLAFAAHVTNVATHSRLTSGSIVTMDGQQHRINLTRIYPTIISTVNELRKICGTEILNPPRIILNAHCPLCPYCDPCRQKAESEDNLSLLGKMTQKVIRRYEKRGIFTIKQLSYVFNPRRRRRKSVAVNSIFNLELQALAMRTEKIYLHKTPLIPTNQVELFLDIEGIPDQGYHYLIGMIAVSQAEIQTYSFWADTQDDEATIFQNCLAVAARYEDAPIYHYGSYEPKAFSKIAKIYGLKTESIEKRLINVNAIIYGKVYFPSKSNRLKDLGALIGATWESPDASGIQSIVWRYRWEEDHDERYKQKLLRYNQDDCQALKRLLNELRHIGNVAMTRNDVEFALKPKQISTDEGHVIHSKLKQIIVSAHEEQYQWNRLKIKRLQDSTDDNEKIRARRVDPIAARNISKKGGITIRLPRKRLCKCHTPLIASEEITERSIIELFFTKSGCKKTIVRYVGKKTVCPSCKNSYFPPTIKLIGNQIFGHQFQSWVVHQRIVLRLPLAAISMQVEDLFNEPLAEASIDFLSDDLRKSMP